VKVVGLLGRARALGFDALATGHYARVEGGRLYRGAGAAKEQAYVRVPPGPGARPRQGPAVRPPPAGPGRAGAPAPAAGRADQAGGPGDRGPARPAGPGTTGGPRAATSSQTGPPPRGR